ncbi:hypothetical protein [Aphanothece minutissima]|uniref:hypothetical protein n=1 Tax=Aphanothece minutissima TaxID=543815 RepID=UPI0011B2671D|nr:hypothetical protein [Aphanothece minutissima]
MAQQIDALANDSGVRCLTSSFSSAPAVGSFQTRGETGDVNTLVVEAGVTVFDLDVVAPMQGRETHHETLTISLP